MEVLRASPHIRDGLELLGFGAQTPSWWVCQGCIFAFLLGIEHVLLAASFLESGFYVEFIWSGA